MFIPAESNPLLDAVIAAPEFHHVLLENDEVRVLEVVVPSGSKEPFHTHGWQSVFVVFGTPHLRYFVPEHAEPIFEIEGQSETGVLYLAPEGLHSLENVDARGLYAFRIELKNAPESDLVPIRGLILEVGTGGERFALENEAFKLGCGADIDARHQASLQIRRSEHGSTALWLGGRSPESFESSDIILKLKYCSELE